MGEISLESFNMLGNVKITVLFFVRGTTRKQSLRKRVEKTYDFLSRLTL